jgi:hypothetical protein
MLTTAAAAALVPAGLFAPVSARAHGDGSIEDLFRQLDQKILEAMEEFATPGWRLGFSTGAGSMSAASG